MIIKRHQIKSELTDSLYELINSRYSELFYAVLIHGSVATGEVIKYSDFDGLLIVKDEWVGSKKMHQFEIDSMQLILKFDPLQHHGWFKIKESDLRNYPEDYMPVAVLEKASLLYPNVTELELNITIGSNINYNRVLLPMLAQFEKRLNTHWKPKNLFQLKSYLSQIMLLPSLYYSAINHKGIFKKDSFAEVRTNFSDKEWLPIERASLIRSKWNYDLNWIQNFLMGRPQNLFRKLTKKFVAPAVCVEFESLMDEEFIDGMRLLILKIKRDI